MTCARCEGCVIIDRYAWPGEEIESREMPHAHCVNCGWTEDPVIRANRMLMAMEKLLHLNVPRVVRDPLAGVVRLKPRRPRRFLRSGTQ